MLLTKTFFKLLVASLRDLPVGEYLLDRTLEWTPSDNLVLDCEGEGSSERNICRLQLQEIFIR